MGISRMRNEFQAGYALRKVKKISEMEKLDMH
jgi:hypothetical protein